MLAGCVPNATSYYRPSMEGGQVLARHCVPTESIVEFGALPMQASIIEGNNGWFASLSLPSKRPSPPAWKTFHFATPDFQMRDLDTGVTTGGLPVRVLRDDKSDSPVEPYRPPQTGGWLYAVDVKLPGPPPEKFELLMPALVIDGREVRYPPIRFERKTWMGISPFNC
jgi:hypothetical protein